MATATHLTEAEAVADIQGILARAKAGELIVIDSLPTPISIRPSDPEELKDPSVEATIARLQAFQEKLGYTPTMDDDFIATMEEIIANRKPRSLRYEPYE